MDLDEAITITQLSMEDSVYYLMVGWQANMFEMYLYSQDDVWVGKFSHKRLLGFSKGLKISEDAYYKNVKNCLSEQKSNYIYELKGGFFYWKRKSHHGLVIEGFMPVELNPSLKNSTPDLIEVLIAINKQLKYKINELRTKYETVTTDYRICLKDTENFLQLKMKMEKSLCEKFLSKIHIKKTEAAVLLHNDAKEESKIMIKVISREPVSNTTSVTSMVNELNEVSNLYIFNESDVTSSNSDDNYNIGN